MDGFFSRVSRGLGLLLLLAAGVAAHAAVLSTVTLATSLPSPQPVNSAVTLTATPTGGTAVQYRFRLRSLSKGSMVWKDLRAYGSSNTYAWKPTATGAYYLEVWAREAGSLMTYEVSHSCRFDVITAPSLQGVSLAIDTASPQPLGAGVALRAAAIGGSSVQYQFWARSQAAASAWTVIRSYGTTATCAWIPERADSYLLRVTAREQGNPQYEVTSNELPFTISPLTGGQVGDRLSVTPYQDQKAAAISFTFDDGLQSQVDIAVPLLDAYGVKGTFGLISGVNRLLDSDPQVPGYTGTPTASWQSWQRVAAAGHEIANHSMTHQNLLFVTDPVALEQEVNGSAAIIASHIGRRPLTFVFPYNNYNGILAAKALEQHICIRQNVVGYGNYLYTAEEMNSAVDAAIAGGAWLVPMLHGFRNGEYGPVAGSIFNAHLSYVQSKSHDVWVDTYANVSRYLQERNAAALQIHGLAANSLTFTVTCPLDASIFNRPLTMRISTGVITAASAQAVVESTGQALATRIVPNGILVNVAPGSGPIRVQWQ